MDATDEQIKQAALGTIPNVAAMFWMFRIMVGLGFYMLALIALSFYFCETRVRSKAMAVKITSVQPSGALDCD